MTLLVNSGDGVARPRRPSLYQAALKDETGLNQQSRLWRGLLHYDRPGDETLVVRLAGSWKLEEGLPAMTEIQQQLEGPPQVRRLIFDAHDPTTWDSGLLTYVREVVEQSRSR